MSSVAGSKVSGIISSLTELEGDLDSLGGKTADMKKQLSIKALNQVEDLLNTAREMASKEAEVLIDAAKDDATSDSARIKQEGQSKLDDIQSGIDANLDKAVSHVVSTILKA